MEKPATTNVDIHPLLTRRYSPRAFMDKNVEASKIQKLIEAARWSPSASNEQPWRFVIGIKGKDKIFDIIFQSLVEFNQIWTKTVPVMIVICAYKLSSKTGKENPYKYYDTGQAAAHMSIQAMEEGLWTHQMGGFDKEKLHTDLNLPPEIEILALMAVGYQGEMDHLPENFQKMEKSGRTRKNVDELVLN